VCVLNQASCSQTIYEHITMFEFSLFNIQT